ncbi:MAG: autotransporter assembly complex family protein [Pseudomonadota bacterium]
MSLAGAAVHAEGLSIEGVDGALADNVRAYVGLDSQPCDAPEWQMRRRFSSADDLARDAMAAFGHYTPQIDAAIRFDASCWHASLTIAPGPRILYERFDVAVTGAAAGDADVDAVVRARPAAGDPLHHGRYEAYKTRLGQVLAARGYAEWRFDASGVDVDVERGLAVGDISIVSGPRYRYGEIRIEQDAFEPGLIERFIDIEPGQPFSRAELIRLQRDLTSSALFDQVTVAPDYDAMAEQEIPLTIRLEPGERIGYFVGVGVSTDRGPRLSGGYRNRRVNARGHQFTAEAEASPVLSRLEARYRQPLKDPRVEWQSYQLRLADEDTDTSESTTAELGVERIRSLPNRWVLTYGLQLSRSDFVVGTVEDTTTLVMPVAGLTRRVSDSDTNPRSGSSLEMRLRGAGTSLGSSTDFLQVYARYRRLIPVGERGRLALRGELGTTWRNDFEELPPQVRFFAGGDTSVRGYAYESLGPVDADGNVIGGTSLVTASVEYEHALRGRWGVAVFADTGNAFDDRDVNERTGVGLGVVWRSPVGPLRAYLAHPLDDDQTVRLHVTFGADL